MDALRGFALVGVGLVHYLERFAGGLLPDYVTDGLGHGPADAILTGVLWASFGKFFALFSILFGVSFAMMAERAADSNDLWRTIGLRSSGLLLIGLLHQAFYRGDILIVYALLGLGLLLVVEWRSRYLSLLAAVCLLGIPATVTWWWTGGYGLEVLAGDSPGAIAYAEVLVAGSWGEVAWANLTVGLTHKMQIYFGFLGRGWYTLAYAIVGVLAWRERRLFAEVDGRLLHFGDLLASLPRVLLALAVAMVVTFAFAGWPVDWSSAYAFVGYRLYDMTNFLVALLLAYGVFRWLRRGGDLPRALVPYGQLALTNYLIQSLVGTALLYGWGGGGLVQLNLPQLFFLCGSLTVIQLVGSRLWRTHIGRGPVEWALRKWMTLTELKVKKRSMGLSPVKKL